MNKWHHASMHGARMNGGLLRLSIVDFSEGTQHRKTRRECEGTDKAMADSPRLALLDINTM
jgi:hypothetical protein